MCQTHVLIVKVLLMKTLILTLVFLTTSYLSFSQPVNNACNNAISLPVGTVFSPTAGTLYASTTASVIGTLGCGSKRDVWYRFTVPALSSAVRISVTLTSSPSTITTGNTFIELLTGNNCTTDSSRGCLNISTIRNFGGLTPGAIYLFRIYSTSSNSTSGGPTAFGFNVAVSSNDDCATAASITPGSTLDGSLFGASATAGVPVDCSTGTPDDDVWYKFTAVYNYATIMASNIGSDLSGSGVRMQLLSGACGSLSSVACGSNTINATGLTPGAEYYCRIYSAGSGQTGSNWGYQMSVFPSARTQITAGRMNEVYDQQTLSAPQALLDPWEITYGPDNRLWITESKGYRVYRVNPDNGVRDTILDISQGSTFLPVGQQTFNCQFANGSGAQGGCAGLVLHPKFLDATAPENYVYVSYVHTKISDSVFINRVVRFEYNTGTGKLESPVSLCDTLPGSNDHNSQRMIIIPVGGKNYLFYAQGDMGAGQFKNSVRTNKAQLTNSYEGKILRFNLEPDGDGGLLDKWIPSTGSGDETNPYSAALGVQSAVWSIGIRNNQGFAYDPVLNKLYGSSHGPFSDDEINVIERGKNYGHPLVIGYSNDGNVNGTTAGAAPGMNPPHPSSCPLITDEAVNAAAIGASYKDPLFSAYPSSPAFPSITNLWNTTAGANAYWPSEGWSGLDFYPHTLIPGWKRSLIAASLKWGRLVRLQLDTSGTATGPTKSAADTISYFGSTNRFRDLTFSPDGKDIYVVLDRSLSTSGPSAANPIITSCQGCLQKYSFLGYANTSGKSSIPVSIKATEGIANTCNPGTTITIDNANNNLWVPITGPDGNIMAEIYPNGQNLGTITSSFYKNVGTIRAVGSAKYLDRNITITPQNQPSGNVKIRLYFSKAEYDSLDRDPLSQVNSITDIKIYKNNSACQSAITVPSTRINPVFSEAHGDSSYVLQAEISGFSSFYFAAASGVLPLTIIDFTGRYRNEISYLNWKTENESNTDYFVVERSIGNSIYEPIGTVFAKGGDGKTNYSFEDRDAATLGVDKLYYRLRITDKDGSYSYSNIVIVKITSNLLASVSVFPNPTDKQTIAIVSSPVEQKVTWKLVDMSGRVVQTRSIMIRKGENRIVLDLQKLNAGIYYLQINGPAINVLEKIQKL